MTKQQLNDDNGYILISKEVVAKITGKVIQDTPGIVAMFVGKKSVNSKFFYKAVNINISEVNDVEIGLRVITKYGFSLPEISHLLQANVKKTLENLTGLLVVNVKVDFAGIV
ncbi:Asp23/Gls24 family envelope stress response protein [Paenibacillus glacialis]|uniref:Alkaline-shock protein n=1 Tax=Paenibacillus glacialis TaxID=494026 RepID=A0A168K902_9BACL|nr:Asp23/Gls24 family envelope stress response protein [Paenibacillus glacialis]OAB41715.1 hypothetical protein PGLA_15700 [Paenibacillus glacialis]